MTPEKKSVDQLTGAELLALSRKNDGSYDTVEYALGYTFNDEDYTLQNIPTSKKKTQPAIKHGFSNNGPFWKNEDAAVKHLQDMIESDALIRDCRLGGQPADLTALGVFPVHRKLARVYQQ